MSASVPLRTAPFELDPTLGDTHIERRWLPPINSFDAPTVSRH